MMGILTFFAGAVTGIVALLGLQYLFYRRYQKAQDALTDGDYGNLVGPCLRPGVPPDPSCIDPTD